MRVGILYSSEKPILKRLSDSLKKGLEKQGAQVQLHPDNADTFSGISTCKLVFVGSFAPSFFKVRTPVRMREALGKSGGLVGRRAVAFTNDRGSRGRKALLSVMADMERQGCIVVDQRTIRSEREAYQFGATVKLG
ncbi:MAG: hypothetical protein JXQ30_15510 [Spirochaetes bacterium]|nr:hypothetical protein [Spirochaetota bacterium]